ncbi:MAG: helix-turn-helix transcriptional regulator [Flavobacteriaceae bacterium]|nr:helix-turn-helix transcriptional regulator [Flavobacteriaceae bacterium]
MPKQFQDEQFIEKVVSEIKSIRKKRGLTQENIYFDTGVHIARIEQKKLNITLSTLKKLCDYFQISMHDFFKGLET